MAPMTRAASLKQVGLLADDTPPGGAAKPDAALPDENSDKQPVAHANGEEGDDDDDDDDENCNSFEDDWASWVWRTLQIRIKATEAARHPLQVFFRTRRETLLDGQNIYYYLHDGSLFTGSRVQVRPGRWRWTITQTDPATLGLPYDPETNADDAALTVAADHEHLRVDTVYIKDFVHPLNLSPPRWASEVRAYELLSKKHPHPNFARYLGCRVMEVPSPTGPPGKKRKRITGIVLERADRKLEDYDADAPEFRDLDVDRMLEQLEDAVAYLHSLGLAHNDIKPGNVLLRANGQPVLIDFEACAPVGAPIHCQGTRGWVENDDDSTSRAEKDLYALKMMRERIRDKAQVRRWFRTSYSSLGKIPSSLRRDE